MNELAQNLINLGFKPIITSINSNYLEGPFISIFFDKDFLDLLLSNINPCGKNGKFHSFVFNKPIFSYPI